MNVVWNRNHQVLDGDFIIGNAEFQPNNTLTIGNVVNQLIADGENLIYRREDHEDFNLTERIENIEQRLDNLQEIVISLERYINNQRNNE